MTQLQALKTIAKQTVARPDILASIQKASQKTGVNFAYLVEKAAAESNFNPAAQSKTSSASGLYQFIDQTWLQMVKQHGAKHGLGAYAAKITRTDNGQFTVNDPQTKKQILALKNNPAHAANMAAEFAKSNASYLKHHVKNVDVGSTELYLAHFMGANGAARFLNAMNQNPEQNAAAIFKKEAAANKNVFFDKDTGKARTLSEVFAFFDKKFDTNTPTPQIAESDAIAHAETTNVKTMQFDPHSFMLSGVGQNTLIPRTLDPINIMLMAEMDMLSWGTGNNTDKENRLFG